jgi:hypothetical protein
LLLELVVSLFEVVDVLERLLVVLDEVGWRGRWGTSQQLFDLGVLLRK